MSFELRAEARRTPAAHKKTPFLKKQAELIAQGLIGPWHHGLLNLLTFSAIVFLLTLITLLSTVQKKLPLMNQDWKNAEKIVLFLKSTIDNQQALRLLKQLQQQHPITQALYISPEEGLRQLTLLTNSNEAIAKLSNNPLPGVIELLPTFSKLSFGEVSQLFKVLSTASFVEHAQFNLEKVKQQQNKILLEQQVTAKVIALLLLLTILLLAHSLLFHTKQDSFFHIASLFYSGIFYGALVALLTWLSLRYSFDLFFAMAKNLLSESSLPLNYQSLSELLLNGVKIGFVSAILASACFLTRVRAGS